MKQTHVRFVVGGLIGIAALFWGVSYYINEQQQDMVNKIIVAIVEQEKTLSAIAEITDKNEADSVAESIIRDCSIDNRNRFDDLLNRLGELGAVELEEIQKLFDGCARFYASRKAVMVARMDREYEVYNDFVELLSVVDDSISVSEYKTEEWSQLVDLEKSRSNIFDRQVQVQQEIIMALSNGEGVASENIQRLLGDAGNINVEAVMVNQQIDALRMGLLEL